MEGAKLIQKEAKNTYLRNIHIQTNTANISKSQLNIFHCSYIYHRFNGLSSALQEDICDWLRQTLNPSELEGERLMRDRLGTHFHVEVH